MFRIYGQLPYKVIIVFLAITHAEEFYDQAAFETWQINQKIGIEVILSKVDPGLILLV